MAILYKKSLSGIINHITITNRHTCVVLILLLTIFHLLFYQCDHCDNYSRTFVNQTFSEYIHDIECILNDLQCTSFIGAGDYNTCFNRLNAQTMCLTDFIRRNILTVSWDHPTSTQQGSCAVALCRSTVKTPKRRFLLFSYGNIIRRHLRICYMLFEHTLIINIWII